MTTKLTHAQIEAGSLLDKIATFLARLDLYGVEALEILQAHLSSEFSDAHDAEFIAAAQKRVQAEINDRRFTATILAEIERGDFDQ